MKKLTSLIILALLFSIGSAQASNNPPPGLGGASGIYNCSGLWCYIYTVSYQGVEGVVAQWQQAANELYLITQGMENDPRYFGAACNTKTFTAGYGPNNTITVFSQGPPIEIQIAGYNWVNSIAGPLPFNTASGDIGTVFSGMGGGTDSGCGGVKAQPIYSIDVANNAAVLAPGSTTTCTALDGAQFGGYPCEGASGACDNTNPANAADDSIPIKNASFDSSVFHGGKTVLPNSCLVGYGSSGEVANNTSLEGNNGGVNYGNAQGYGRFFGSNTTLYCSSDSSADDQNLCIEVNGSGSSNQVAFRNFTIQCNTHPFGFAGLTMAAIGNTASQGLNSEQVLLDHMSFLLCPVGFGNPVGWNQPVNFTAAITNGIMTVTAISSPPFPGVAADSNLTTAYLALGRTVTAGNITTGPTIVSAPANGLAGQYVLSDLTITTSSENMSLVAEGTFIGGQARFSQFTNNMIGQNGDRSDWGDLWNTYTGNYGTGTYLGPFHGSAGNGANYYMDRRWEENVQAFVCDGCEYTQISGQFQFNSGPAITTVNNWNHLLVSGFFEDNGPAATFSLGGNGHDFDVVNPVQIYNLAGQTQTPFIFQTTTGANVDYVSLQGGDVRSGFATAVSDWTQDKPAHYKQDAPGIPAIDTTEALTASSTGFSIGGLSGGAMYATTSAKSTSETGVVNLTLPAVDANWLCSGGDQTSHAAFSLGPTTSTSAALYATSTVTNGDVLYFSCPRGN